MASSSTNSTNFRVGLGDRLNRFRRKLQHRTNGASSQSPHNPHAGASSVPVVLPLRTNDVTAQPSASGKIVASPRVDLISGLDQHVQKGVDGITTHPDGHLMMNISADLWSAAYREAVESLGKDIDVAILKGSSVAELFKQLEEIDRSVSQESAFLRGVAFLRSIQVPLETFKLALDLASPLSNLEPIAGTVFGVVKGVTAIAITFASADLEFAKQIGEMLKQLSYIDDCDMLGQKENRQDIHKALVPVYQNVLEFYQVAYEILTRRGPKLVVKIVLESDRLPSVVKDFLKNADTLGKLIQKATLEIAADIRTMLYDQDIDRWLGRNKVSLQADNHEVLQQLRSDEACAFLLTHPDFERWYDATDSEWLLIFGDMGHGKTVAMSFIIDELLRRNKQQLPQPKVCYHYCRNDDTGQAVYIFSTLILKLLQQLPGLKKTFHLWYTNKQTSGIGDPVRHTKELVEFFNTIIKTLDRPLFIVIDGLDECSRVSREILLKSFRTLSQATSRLKIIISSRPEKEILEQLQNISRIDLGSDKLRDTMIVRHLVEKQLYYLTEEVKTLVIEALSQLAQGSAIWTKMTVNLIEGDQTEELEPMRRILKGLPLPDELSELYTSTVTRYTNNDRRRKDVAVIALKLLAAARRPLSIQELAWAVAMALYRDEVTSIAELTKLVDYHKVMGVIHPFITNPDLKDLTKRQVRLGHQSVKEFVIREWYLQNPSTATIPVQLKSHQQIECLESFILEICIDYLLLDEIGRHPLFSEAQVAIHELPQEVDLFDDIQPSEYDLSCTWEAWEENMIRYDPVERDFGHFFVYAASQWPQHLGAVENSDLSTLTKIESLCQTGSLRLHNWIDQNCRPDCVIKARFEFDHQLYDPLSIVSLYGSDTMLQSLLTYSDFDEDKYLPAPAMAAADQILQWGNLSRLRVLFLEAKFTRWLHTLAFFQLIIWWWSRIGVRHDNWGVAFDLVEIALDTLVQEQWGRELLCVAARAGCIPIIQRLLNGARHKSELRNELLQGSQSVAQAIMGNHADVVEYLLDQEGFEAHLQYVNNNSEHVLHLASRICNPAIFRLLVPRLHVRIHQTDSQGRTVLKRIIESHATLQSRYESVRILLLSPAYSGKIGYSTNEEDSPLRMAVKLGDVDICRLLIYDGRLDAKSALTHGEDGTLVLKDEPQINKETITKLLRGAVSTIK